MVIMMMMIIIIIIIIIINNDNGGPFSRRGQVHVKMFSISTFTLTLK